MTELYRLGLRRSFRAFHALIGGNWGAENQRHFHDYLWEIRISRAHLDSFGYLLDLDKLENILDLVLYEFSGAFLNEIEDFRDLNPSLERFARVLGQRVLAQLDIPEVDLESVLWENDSAWASWKKS